MWIARTRQLLIMEIFAARDLYIYTGSISAASDKVLITAHVSENLKDCLSSYAWRSRDSLQFPLLISIRHRPDVRFFRLESPLFSTFIFTYNTRVWNSFDRSPRLPFIHIPIYYIVSISDEDLCFHARRLFPRSKCVDWILSNDADEEPVVIPIPVCVLYLVTANIFFRTLRVCLHVPSKTHRTIIRYSIKASLRRKNSFALGDYTRKWLSVSLLYATTWKQWKIHSWCSESNLKVLKKKKKNANAAALHIYVLSIFYVGEAFLEIRRGGV